MKGNGQELMKKTGGDIESHHIFVILMLFHTFSIYFQLLLTLYESYRLYNVYSTKRIKGNGQKLMKWDCLNICDICNCVT